MAREKIYTRAGDDGTTGLFYGGRVGKDSALPRAYGAVDEAQAILGLVRAEAGKGTELDDLLVHIMRDLWVLMAELATLPENRHKLVDGKSRVTAEVLTKSSLRQQSSSCQEKTRLPRCLMLVAQLHVAPSDIRLRLHHHHRRPARISIVCQIYCGQLRVGKKANRCR
jgi:ATP:cob(I)alamin adenosyltransferase